MGGAKLEVRPVPLSSVLDWFPTPQAPRSRAQAFKFSLYLAIPIGLTAAVVLRQDVLESIIKSVSSNRLSIQL
jgi:ABC-type antimicrobial peptide transport system permease subunit